MPLHINLLHEEQAKIVERERDPLKIGLLGLLVLGLALYGYYLMRSMQSNKLQADRNNMQEQVDQLEPKAVTARAIEDQSNQARTATDNIEKIINDRFYWGPLLAQFVKNTGPDVQINKMECTLADSNATLKILIDGLSAGQEPRAVAERFRQHFQEVLGKSVGRTDSQFNTLENNPAKITLGGKSLDTAVFNIEFNVIIQPELIHAKVQ